MGGPRCCSAQSAHKAQKLLNGLNARREGLHIMTNLAKSNQQAHHKAGQEGQVETYATCTCTVFSAKMHGLLLIPVWVEGLCDDTRFDHVICKYGFHIPARFMRSIAFLLHVVFCAETQNQTSAMSCYSNTSTHGSLKPL